MGKTRKQDGLQLTVAAPAAGTTMGIGFRVGNLFGVAVTTETSGEDVVMERFGVFELDKETPLVISEGDDVYWDEANLRVDKTNTNYRIGTAHGDAASGDTEVDVVLSGFADDPAASGFLGILNTVTTPVAVVPNDIVVENWVAPFACTITGIGVGCTTQPTTGGVYTLAVAGAGNNLLVAATADLDATITGGVYLALALTATAADLTLAEDDFCTLTFTSDNLDLVGDGLFFQIRFSAV